MPLNSSDQQPIVNAHNAYRSDPSVNTPNLVWDSTLATGAQTWADTLAQTGTFAHSPDAQNGTVGENIAQSSTGSTTPAQMVDLWGKTVVNGRSEQAQFQPGIMPNVSKDGGTVGHYTQVVSRLSTSVGCGMATGTAIDPKTGKTTDYLVCRYSPPGNQTGAGYVSPQPVTLAQVSVADSKTAFGVDAANNVYMYSSSDGANWTPQYSITGQQLKQVSIASDYTICGLDPSGNAWQGSALSFPITWTKMAAGPVTFISLSCGSSTTIFAVGTDGLYYQNTGSGWTKITTGYDGKQISVASDGTVWARAASNGYLYQYTASGWTTADMRQWSFTQHSCGSATNLWVMGLNGQFYQYTPSASFPWTQAAPGTGKQVSVAADGTVWSIGTNNQVSRLVNNAWTPLLV